MDDLGKTKRAYLTFLASPLQTALLTLDGQLVTLRKRENVRVGDADMSTIDVQWPVLTDASRESGTFAGVLRFIETNCAHGAIRVLPTSDSMRSYLRTCRYVQHGEHMVRVHNARI